MKQNAEFCKEHINRLCRSDAVFHALIKEFGEDSEFHRHYIISNWRKIVGDVIADHIKVQKLKHKILFLTADTSAWGNEIQIHEVDIVQKVNSYAGCYMVRELKFTGESYFNRNADYVPMPDERAKIASERKKISSINLKDSEINRIKNMTADIEDEKLKNLFQRVIMQNKKLQKYRIQKGWQPCPICGEMMEPERRICYSCSLRKTSQTREKIYQVLKKKPWAIRSDFTGIVECSDDFINQVRAEILQALLPSVDTDHPESEIAKIVTMLELHAKPEELENDKNHKLVKKAFSKLRYDLGDKYFNTVRKQRQAENDKLNDFVDRLMKA